jgi:Ca-activated chloride channel family protein
MTFLRPDLWWVAPIAAFVIVLVRALLPRRAVAFTRVALLTRPGFRTSWVRRLPDALAWLSLAAVVLALMSPAVVRQEQQVAARGLDIVFVVDLSVSMTGPIGVTGEVSGPYVPTAAGASRMDATKEALRTFINLRRDDRIGIVVFSDNGYIVCPLTFDREHLLNYFDRLDPNALPGESLTAIGEGITAATALLSKQSAPNVMNKVIVVFTDGANNAGRDPVEALKEATLAGIRVHVVGIDLEAEMTRSPQVVRLVNTTKAYGGRYFAASTKFDLTGASRSLDELEKGFLLTRTFQRSDPVGRWFALAALLLLGGACICRAVPFFVALH